MASSSAQRALSTVRFLLRNNNNNIGVSVSSSSSCSQNVRLPLARGHYQSLNVCRNGNRNFHNVAFSAPITTIPWEKRIGGGGGGGIISTPLVPRNMTLSLSCRTALLLGSTAALPPFSAASAPTTSAAIARRTMATAATARVRTGGDATKKKRKRPVPGNVLTLTSSAVAQIQRLQAAAPDGHTLRVGVRTRGCSGNAFHLEFVPEKAKFDETVTQDGATVLVEATAIMKVIGSTMDFVVDEEGLREEFVFDNPQAAGMCGCGESWHT